MIEVRLDGPQLRRVMQALSVSELTQRARGAMSESVNYVEAEVIKGITPHRNTGMTEQAMFTEIRGATLADLRGIVGNPLQHAIVLERGRRPGGKFPPRGPIALWAQRKLDVTDPGIVWLIMRKIAVKGTRALHMFENAARKAPPVLERIWLRHLQDFGSVR